jgi:hypothetical protein
MRPRLGPKGLLLLRHMAESGPITPRQGGAILLPHAQGTGSVRGAGRGNTDARGTANRAAGALLGHMARAGWVVASQGERYAIPYSITDVGREAIRAEQAKIEGDPLCGPHDPITADRKRCTHCGRARLRSAFYGDRTSKDGLGKRCRYCSNEEQAELRSAIILSRDAEAAWQRASKPVIILRCLALIRAARVARRVGTWRGRDGIRAYAALGESLDAFTGNGRDPSAIADEACDPTDRGPPHHCDPSDTDWDPRRHENPEHIRRLMREAV